MWLKVSLLFIWNEKLLRHYRRPITIGNDFNGAGFSAVIQYQ